MAQANSDLSHLKLPPIKVSLNDSSSLHDKVVLPPIAQISPELARFDKPAPFIVCSDNLIPTCNRVSSNSSTPGLSIPYTKQLSQLVQAHQPKSRNAEASARSRQKRREREAAAKGLNEKLNLEAQELEKKNKVLCEELNSLDTEYKYLCADLKILKQSRDMDQELLTEIEREIEWNKLIASGIHVQAPKPDPRGLAKRQLELTQKQYQGMLDKYTSLDEQRIKLEQYLMEQQITQLAI